MTGSTPATGPEKKILLVEDEALIAMDLRQRLQRLGYTVISSAKTADDALNLAISHVPDLILMDIHLQGSRDGIHAAQEIQQKLDVPIVYLTAHSDNVTLDRAKITGPFGYITKPYDIDSLRAQIEMAIARHEAEQKLRRSEAWLSTTLRNIGEAVIATNSAGRIEFINPVAEELTGWTMVEAIGQPVSDVFPLLDLKTGGTAEHPVQAVLTPESSSGVSGEYGLRIMPSGSIAVVHTVISANRSEDGQLLGAIVVFRDMTSQRELERRAQESRNMEVIALMAGGLAHDFNNLLTVILGYTDVARVNAEKVPDALSQIRRAGESAALLCQQLLTVSRHDVAPAQVFDLNACVHDNANMLDQIIGPNCRFVEKLAPQPLPVAADRAQIQQVLINLAINARDAMAPAGGTFTISARHDETTGAAEVRISDTGAGMAEETARRIFEPFFSRKSSRGTGLGMTMVHSLVTKWGGAIDVKSKPGEGTEFIITFPLSEMPLTEERAEAHPEAGELAGVHGKILLVEDDTMIRDFLGEQLQAAGFQVVAASTGEEALAIPGDQIDLLITDVMMPKMRGSELAKRCLERWPEIRILFISGYTEEELRDNELLKSGRAAFVPKPVTPESLVATARMMIARKNGSKNGKNGGH